MTPNGPPTSWWQTLPGILTAIAGVLVALTGLIAVLHSAGILGPAPEDPPPAAEVEVAEPSPPPPAPSAGRVAPPPPSSPAPARTAVEPPPPAPPPSGPAPPVAAEVEAPAIENAGFSIKVTVERLEVLKDCDSGPGSGEFIYSFEVNDQVLVDLRPEDNIEIDSPGKVDINKSIGLDVVGESAALRIRASVTEVDDDGKKLEPLGEQRFDLEVARGQLEPITRALDFRKAADCHAKLWYRVVAAPGR